MDWLCKYHNRCGPVRQLTQSQKSGFLRGYSPILYGNISKNRINPTEVPVFDSVCPDALYLSLFNCVIWSYDHIYPRSLLRIHSHNSGNNQTIQHRYIRKLCIFFRLLKRIPKYFCHILCSKKGAQSAPFTPYIVFGSDRKGTRQEPASPHPESDRGPHRSVPQPWAPHFRHKP